MLNIGWFSSGRDEAARSLLEVAYRAIQDGQIVGRIGEMLARLAIRRAGAHSGLPSFARLAQEYSRFFESPINS